jgi:FlaA1/EpsC-like NDP-sugar epimerase
MEFDIEEAITSNVIGTQIVLEAAECHGVDRFVLISSIKATDPTDTFGMTKRLAELLVADTAHRSQRPYLTVRLGNLLDEHYSMISYSCGGAAGIPINLTQQHARLFHDDHGCAAGSGGVSRSSRRSLCP